MHLWKATVHGIWTDLHLSQLKDKNVNIHLIIKATFSLQTKHSHSNYLIFLIVLVRPVATLAVQEGLSIKKYFKEGLSTKTIHIYMEKLKKKWLFKFQYRFITIIDSLSNKNYTRSENFDFEASLAMNGICDFFDFHILSVFFGHLLDFRYGESIIPLKGIGDLHKLNS